MSEQRAEAVGDAIAAAAHRLGEGAAHVLARLGGSVGESARSSHEALAALAAPSNKRRRAEIAVAARAPVPAGVRAVHPSWIEHALASLPQRARTAVAAPTDDPVDVWLARYATASLPPMPRGDKAPIARLVARDAGLILDWLARLGGGDVVIGARALAPHIADDAVARLQLTRRLPRDTGLLVERELVAHAGDPLELSLELPAL